MRLFSLVGCSVPAIIGKRRYGKLMNVNALCKDQADLSARQALGQGRP